MNHQSVTATALAHPNIAFIKYWGNRDSDLRIPANGSISMNLDGLTTRTSVTIDPDLSADELILRGNLTSGQALERVSKLIQIVRSRAGKNLCTRVESINNFPTGAGIASSASAFAALSLAASAAFGLSLSEAELSRLARTGSGSACRSVPGGFVEWQAGADDDSSFAFSIAPPDHWNLVDCIAIVNQAHKPTGSTEGHLLADTSIFQNTRLLDTPRRLKLCREAILHRDFSKLAEIAEFDSNLMHAVMMTSHPPLLYWEPETIALMKVVSTWRKLGLPVFYTIDAGANVHILCLDDYFEEVKGKIMEVQGIQYVITAPPGGSARLVQERE
jgi:diphosphomevalonate decarboxylase